MFVKCPLNVHYPFRVFEKCSFFLLFVHWMFTEFIDCSLNKRTLKWYVHFLFIEFEWTNTCSLRLNEQNKMNKQWTHNEQIINKLNTFSLNVRLFVIVFIFCSFVVRFFGFIFCSFFVHFLFVFSAHFLFVWNVRFYIVFLIRFCSFLVHCLFVFLFIFLIVFGSFSVHFIFVKIFWKKVCRNRLLETAMFVQMI